MRAKSEKRLKRQEEAGFKHEVLKLRKVYSNSHRYR